MRFIYALPHAHHGAVIKHAQMRLTRLTAQREKEGQRDQFEGF